MHLLCLLQESSLNHAPQPRPKFTVTPPEITTRRRSAPAQNTTSGEQSSGSPASCNQRKTEGKVPQKTQEELKHTRISLIQCRKIFKKKKSHSEEHTYMEINDAKVTNESAESQPAANVEHQEVESVSCTLPLEYLNPPPFAPGY